MARSWLRGARWPSAPRLGLGTLAVGAAGLIVGAAYALATPVLAPYAPLRLASGWFFLIVLTSSAAVAIGLEQPRAALAAVPPIAAVAGAVIGLVLALPAFTDADLNAVGLTNYAITQGAFAFFILLPLVFFGASLGLVLTYLWHDRRS